MEMSYSQSDLAGRFAQGYTTGKASNVEIHELDDGSTVLVGYGHAVYAHRSAAGRITTYYGWYNSDNTRRWAGTMSTKHQFTTMGLKSLGDDVKEGESIDAAPKLTGFKPPQLV